MTDPSLASAWLGQMSTLFHQVVLLAVLCFLTVYAGVSAYFLSRWAHAHRRFIGGGSYA